MVSVPAGQLSSGLVHLSMCGSFPPLARGLVQAQLSLTSDMYGSVELLPVSLAGRDGAAGLVAGTRAALVLVQMHALPSDLGTLQACRWLYLASADDGPLARDVAAQVPLAPAAGKIEALLSSADGEPAASRRALRALSALLWACACTSTGAPVHPLVTVLGEARSLAVMAHVSRLYRLALVHSGLSGLALAWDTMEAVLLLTEHTGGTLPPKILEAVADVRADAHAVQHVLDDPAAPSGGLDRYDALSTAVAGCVRPPLSVPAPAPAPAPSPPPPPHPLVERRNIFSDADLLRAQRVTHEVSLGALDEDAKRAIVARGLAESDDEVEGGTLGVFANPFGAAREEEGADGDSDDDEVGVLPPRGNPTEEDADAVDDDEPTGIYRRQRVVRGSNPRGVNDWRTRAEDWDVSSSDEGNLPGPRAPISSSRGADSGSGSGFGAPSTSAAGGVQLGDERILLAAYGAPGGDKDLTKAGRRGKTRAQLKEALGGRWDDHQIESWASMLVRNPKKEALLAPYSRTGNVLFAGGNTNVRPMPASATSTSTEGGTGKARKDNTKDEKKDVKRPLNEREKRNKERRGNVARKRGADRKAARAGVFPAE